MGYGASTSTRPTCFGDAKESIPPPRGKRQTITPRSGTTKQKGWPQYRDGMQPTLRGTANVEM
jgi:hypothetical protein